MKWLNKIKDIITWTVFLVVFTIGALIFLSGKSDVRGWRLLIVKSGSMEPTIKTGSLIFVKKQGAYQKGDIVTFGPLTRPELLVTHRIVDVVDKEGKRFIKTKGDFNAAEDQELTPESSIIAKYFVGIPLVGYVISFAQTQIGVVILIVVPGTILIYDELMNLKKNLIKLHEKMFKKNKESSNTEKVAHEGT